MSDKKETYYIAICEVYDAHGITYTVERLGNAWWYSIQAAQGKTPVRGKLVKMRQCSKEEFFAS